MRRSLEVKEGATGADNHEVSTSDASAHLSPELVLVCPQLREAALAGLPDRDPDAWLDCLCRRADPAYELMQSVAVQRDGPDDEDWSAPLPVAVIAYAIAKATTLAVESAAVVGIVVGVLSLIAVVRA